ncbi:MAG TPA: SlyX family protein [Geobacteraceae bacterium]
MNERLSDLEIHYMHLERTVQELNTIVCRQQQTIERLEQELRDIKNQFLAVVPSLVTPPEEEPPPPHY